MVVTVKQLKNELSDALGLRDVSIIASKDSLTLNIGEEEITCSKKLFKEVTKIWINTKSTGRQFTEALREIQDGLDMSNALTSNNPIIRGYYENNIAASTRDYRSNEEYLKNVVKGQKNEPRIMSIFQNCFQSVTRQSSDKFLTKGNISTKFDYKVTTLSGKQLEIDISAVKHISDDEYDCKLHKVDGLLAGNIMIWQVNGKGYMVVSKDNLFGEVFYHNKWEEKCMKFKSPYLTRQQVKDYLITL